MKKLLILLIVLASCSVTNKKHSSGPIHFFACNKWTDQNHNGKYDSFEFENIKDTFTASEHIIFVGFFFDSPTGSMISFSLYAPDGSLAQQVSQPKVFRATLTHPEYMVADLISAGSTGIWEAVWDIDGEVVADIEVKLIY